MTDIERLAAIKKLVESCRSKADRARGVVEKLVETLRRDWGCKSLEDAISRLEEMKVELREKEQAFQKSLAEFEAKWGDKLREMGGADGR